MTAKRKILIAVLAGAVVLAGGAFAWKNGKGPSTGAHGAESAKSVERPLELIAAELHTIKPRGLVDTVRFTGTTQPIDQTIVKARVAGRLAEVLVREGDHVTKDQVLARFEAAGGRLDFEWGGSTEVVVVTVRAHRPSLLPRVRFPFETIERTVRVRRERVR